MSKPTKQQIDESENPDVKAIAEDLEVYSTLDSIATSPGGQLLVQNALKDAVTCVERLCNGYETLTRVEMIGICADMKTKLDMVRSIARAHMNKDDAESALVEALKS